MFTDIEKRWFWSPDDAPAGSGDEPEPTDRDESDGESAGRDDDDLTTLKATLQKERKFRRDAERSLKELQRRVAEFENRDKSETDKLRDELNAVAKRAEEAERRVRDANARVAVVQAATKANAISPVAVYALIRDNLEYDDNGEPTNVTEALADLRKSEPRLFLAAAGRTDGGTRDERPETTTGADFNTMLRDKMRRRR